LKPIPPKSIYYEIVIEDVNKIVNPVVLVTIVGLIFIERSIGTTTIPPPIPSVPAHIPAMNE